MPTASLTVSLLLATTTIAGGASAPAPWSDVAADEVGLAAGERRITPSRARIVRLDTASLLATIRNAPSETVAPAGLVGAELAIPDVDGGFVTYRVVDSPVMAPELAAKFPEIRTFRLIHPTDSALGGRGDWTPHGFHAMLRTASGLLFVDPLRQGDRELHQVYFKRDLAPPKDWRCLVDDAELGSELEPVPAAVPEGAGLDLRTYRLVVAATGEYTTFHGGTVPLGMAAIVTAVNRVNEVYERDVAIRMVLVANNDLVVYTNGGSDPYTNNDGFAMLGQNTTNLNNVIGLANYDIGHVFSTGGGGVATLNGPCGANKARGVTGLPSPIGDPFYIDFVAHEMGHQWGGNHSFNGNSSNCSGGNRNPSTAYEPGSGTTIMAYAGICPPQNVQNFSDDYFHRVSIDEIVNFSRVGNGNTCAALGSENNLAPTADAGAAYTIPKSTPFSLTGSGSDGDGGTVSFCWEEFDLGPAGHPNTPSGNAPIFRSFDPTSSPTRTFPQLSDLLNNTQTLGEILPTYARTLNFRLTVRDNQLPAGNQAFDSTTVTVDAASGPFLVTHPNTGTELWFSTDSEEVTWDPAGTTAAPVSCANVDILLSTDGGTTFPVTLATATANDGAEVVSVAASPTNQARVQVRCNGNVFFDLSNEDFRVVDIADQIFVDGFESGDTSAWTATVP